MDRGRDPARPFGVEEAAAAGSDEGPAGEVLLVPRLLADLSPDWVCEILSPSTARFDRVTKLPIFRQAGVGNVWIIDPVARTLEVLRRHEESWLLAAAHQ